MRVRTKLGLSLCAGVVLAAVNLAFPQEKQSGTEPKPQGGQEMDQMMEQWMKMNQPGEHHKHLAPLVGTWTTVVKMRYTPDAPWQESTGTLLRESIWGGRYVTEEYKETRETPGGPADHPPFEGMGVIGYDTMKKQYVGGWIDNMSTGLMTSTGTCDPTAKTFTFIGEYLDPMTGKPKQSKHVIKITSKDQHVMEMYEVGPDGKEFVSFEMTCTRK